MNRKPNEDLEPIASTEEIEGQPVDGGADGGMDRRTFLKTVGVGVAAAALTQSFSPHMFARAQGNGAIKLGLLEDRSGDFALFGAPKFHGAQLAIAEINQGLTLAGGPVGPGGLGVSAMRAADAPAQRLGTGRRLETTHAGGEQTVPGVVHAEEDEILIPSGDEGINGRPIDLIAPDPQSDNTLYQRLARRLILDDGVDVLFAGFSSASREATRPIINQLDTLYFYNNQYEGGVADKNTFCTGAVAEQQIAPAMEYMVRNFGPRIYILAADYNFGHLSAAWTKAFAPMLGAQIIGEEYIPLEVSEFSTVISRLQSASPDWVMMYITGENHANYYPQANAAGVRFPMGSSINMAQGYEHLRFSAPALQDMHVAVNYMQEIPTARNQAFVERWHAMFPNEPYISQQSQNSYNAVHLYAKAARLAGTTEKNSVIEALESGMHMEAPEGSLFMEPGTHHCSHYIRLAHADADHNISFIREWPMIEAWWLQRLGVNLVRIAEAKQYEPDEDPFFRKFV
jgi:urea transport system substrate-binding protein